MRPFTAPICTSTGNKFWIRYVDDPFRGYQPVSYRSKYPPCTEDLTVLARVAERGNDGAAFVLQRIKLEMRAS